MKVAIAIFALIALAAATNSDDFLFRKFIFQHKKVYSTDEFQVRFKNFQSNLRNIERLNKIPGQEATFGINKFSDLSVAEFESIYLLPKFDAADICIWPYHERAGNGMGSLPEAVPKSFDWRTKGAVTPIKNQGDCGSCWSFSTTGNLEGQWALWSSQKKLVGLSEQWLVDCSHGCIASDPSLCNSGCGGGLPWLAYEDIHSNNGIPTEASYPYVGEEGTCQSKHPNVANVANWTSVSSNPNDIIAFLVKQGPLSITLNAGMLMSYTSGIITGSTSECPVSQMDHAVLLVGYDNSGATPYWIVKNSWGTDWGVDGYFKIASAQGLCGINACVTTSLVN